MSRTLDAFRTLGEDGIAPRLQEAGVAGAGGGGFPSYVKWRRIDEANHLLVNHQESEPNCYMDKWLGREYPDRLADLFDALLDVTLDTVVIGAKYSKRDRWLLPLEDATDGTVYTPDELPIDPEEEEGVVFAYTEDKYEYGMENILLQTVADTILGKDLPIDYGWIVQNTETMYNIWRAVVEEEPVTHKFVNVDGYLADGSRLRHRMLEVPIGTPATTLLEAAGVDPADLSDDRVLADGGPGWCFEVQRPPSRLGIRKRTNCLLVLGEDTVEEHTYGNDRINVLEPLDWSLDDPDTEPSRTVLPTKTNVPIVTNDSYGDLIAPSEPVVDLGDEVSRGDPLAEPVEDGFSVYHHASVHGEVTDVTPREIEVRHTGR
jgi:Na+-translocating ferredoxin:NAD+ oxidoreductase RnfC subunit